MLLDATLSNTPEYVVCKVYIRNINLAIASLYTQPLTPLADREIRAIFRSLSVPYILCGSFNARNLLRGSDHSDARGRTLEDAIDKFDSGILNDESPTFQRGSTYCSCLYLTICSQDHTVHSS